MYRKFSLFKEFIVLTKVSNIQLELPDQLPSDTLKEVQSRSRNESYNSQQSAGKYWSSPLFPDFRSDRRTPFSPNIRPAATAMKQTVHVSWTLANQQEQVQRLELGNEQSDANLPL